MVAPCNCKHANTRPMAPEANDGKTLLCLDCGAKGTVYEFQLDRVAERADRTATPPATDSDELAWSVFASDFPEAARAVDARITEAIRDGIENSHPWQRDEFAGRAMAAIINAPMSHEVMQELCGRRPGHENEVAATIADSAYAMADAMMAARSKQ